MAGTTDTDEIPKDLALVLLRRLADDDAFRTQYEQDPANALKSLGFPEAITKGIPPGPVKLGSKALFQEALYQVIDDVAHVYHCQMPPNVKLAIGKNATVNDPFQGS